MVLMKRENGKRKIPWGMLYILATVLAVVLFGALNRELGNVFRVLGGLRPGWLSLAFAATAVFFVLEGGIIRLLLRGEGTGLSLPAAMKVGLIGVYYSYITPSATGGQPMQAVYLRRERIPVGFSTAMLFLKFVCYQCAFVLISLVSFFAMLPVLRERQPGLIPFILLGLVINGGSVVFFSLLFRRRVLHALCAVARRLMGRLRFLRRWEGSVERFERDFGGYAAQLSGRRKQVLWGILLSLPQFVLQMSVIYLVFRAFGYESVRYWEVLAVQSLLQVSVSFMPMPGASGAQEIGFSAFFRDYFAQGDLYTAVMVWRFFTYYLVVLAGGLLVVIDQFWYGRRKKEEKSVVG